MLLAKVAYMLEILAWQNTKDATKKNPANTPKLDWLPDYMRKLVEKDQNKNNLADRAYDIDELKTILAKPRK